MRAERILLAAAAALAAALGGCGSDQETVRIGVLTDCQGPFASFEDAQLSGAELPFLRRGAHLVGTSPSAGVTEIELGGRRIELVRGCQESGEHTVFIEEARRLLETEHVDVIVGGASVVARDLAHRYPDAVFVSTFWDEPEVTMRRPAANLFRFSPDYAQQAAGLGTYAYRDLGWRSASLVAATQTSGWAGAAAFTAEFCALGGRVVSTSYRSIYTGTPNVAARALAPRPDGVATFLTSSTTPPRSSVRWPRGSTTLTVCSCGVRASKTERSYRRSGDASTASSARRGFRPRHRRRPSRLSRALACCVPRSARISRRPIGGDRLPQLGRGGPHRS